MNINCPQCGKEYEIDDAKIPKGGAKVKCSQCETMIDIDFPVVPAPDWYITTDGENIYEATTEEVTDWIQENRLLREHKISKDNKNWTTLEENPKFLVIFEDKEKEESIAEEPTEENSSQEEPIVKAYKKIDYTDYDDSIIESSDTYKPKKSHFFIWFILFLIMGAGIFALIKPKLVKSWFMKMNSKTNTDTSYNEAVKLSKQYNLQNKDKIIYLFDNALKKNPKDIKPLTGKALYITHLIYLEKLNIEFRTKLFKKLEILSKQNNNEIINKILLNNNKKLLKSKRTLKDLNTLLTQEYKNKLKEIEKTKNNYTTSIVMGLLSYFDTNKNALSIHLSNAKKLDLDNPETSLLKLLYLKLKKDNSYLVVLDESTTKYANSIPLNILNAFELLNQDKFGEAKSSFKGIKGLTPDNKLVLEYILLLNNLIKNKDLLVVAKTSEEKNSKDKLKDTPLKKEENKVDKNNAKISTNNNPKEIKKEVKKAVKKLSPSRATEIGWELIDANKLSSAIKKFKYAISVNPNYAEAYQGLGEVYRIRKDNENAIKYFKIFLAKDPHNSEAGLVKRQIKKLSSDK